MSYYIKYETYIIIVPCYNERKKYIIICVSSFRPIFDSLKSKYDFEILFVNDGSTDKTLDEMYKVIDSNNDLNIKAYRSIS